MSTRPTKAQRRMLQVHASVYPGALAHTHKLGRLATWRSLYDAGWVKGGVITDEGRAAITMSDAEERQ